MGKEMCYNMAATLTPVAIFTMVGHPVDNNAAYELTSHSVAYELTRYTSSAILQLDRDSNYIGFSERHFHMLPSSNLDEHRLLACVRSMI